jgi:hypothetical protein
MSETAGAENVIPPEGGDSAEVTQVADNPAWSDFLSGFPASMHDQIKPHLTKWDQGVNQRIEQVHSEWADFKPYKDAGISREVLDQAYGIFQALNENPQEVYRILGETYGLNVQPQVNPTPVPNGQGQTNPQQQTNQPTGDEYELGQGGQFNPEIARLQAMTENMANIMLAQEQQRQQAAEDAALDNELRAAHAKHGNFDDDFVLRYLSSGMNMDQAVGAYNAMLNQVRSDANRPQAPTVITGGGALPSNQINPANLNNKDTRSLVANMMKAANQQG